MLSNMAIMFLPRAVNSGLWYQVPFQFVLEGPMLFNYRYKSRENKKGNLTKIAFFITYLVI